MSWPPPFNQYSNNFEHKLVKLQYDKEALICKNVMYFISFIQRCITLVCRIFKMILTTSKKNTNLTDGRNKLIGWSKEVEHLRQEALLYTMMISPVLL